ncbi:tetratricopeptide repeat protein [Dactylosporangium sp. AC04546]|uniref:tetratricopeptide repeat protein n=1 Tax=Dactylosporangium sp. AC04546 TaxID=2862460 RepID=UPI002E7C0C12|nr:tetratricopeptide repeat protein [Dactylosporangium sp. AC04546]WVK82001.1 tetratricopeptide repeat protein [Dactylosporangium sp. AC04546]
MPDRDRHPDRPVVSVQVPGQRAAGVGHNAGIAQTGDHAQAWQLSGAVTLRPPAEVPALAGGLVGLPKPPARAFVGRDDQLAALDGLVRAGAGVVAQTVHGLGGVGKTELALQYAHRHRGRYRLVWWVLAESAETVAAGLAELAFRLHPDLRAVGTAQADAATWAVGWFASHDGWLLILDNVEARADVEPLLGQADTGQVLITTRRDVGWEDITDGCLRLDVLAPADAVALLLRLSGQTDAATAGVLAGELGCLPLALQQAGAYLRQTRTPITDYLQQLREDPAGLLATVAAGNDAQRAVARTWTVTTNAVTAQNPLTLRLLRLLACYAPNDLPRDVLTPTAAPAAVDTALGVLASYNLITLTAQAISTHRLVQAVTRSQLQHSTPDASTDIDEVSESSDRPEPGVNDTNWPDTLRVAINMLKQAVPPGSPQQEVASWPRWAVLSPHVGTLAEHCPDHVGGDDLAWLLNETAVFEHSQGRYWQASTYQRRALVITEAALGPDHPATATRLSNLAGSLQELGRAGEAEPLQRRALAITEAALGPDHPTTATSLSNLALSLQTLGRAGEAERLQRRALAITEAALGPDHPDTATRLDNLAGSLRDLGRAGEAEPLQRRALAITEAAFGPDHPDTANRLGNLALSLQQLGRAGEAEPLQRRALAITEAALGPDHPDTAIRLNNLALSLQTLGRAGEAERLQRRALAITEAALGPDHPTTATRLDNLAGSLWDLGRAGEAEPLQRRALAITEAAFGPDHPTTATRLSNLAGSLWDLGRAGEAEPLQRRALAITEAAFGPDHPDTATRLDNLAGSLRDLGRAGEAERLQRRALAITEAAFGPDHPDTATRLDNLALSLQALGRASQAERLQRRALAITEAALGPDHPDTAIRLNNLALSLQTLGRAGEAERLQRRALAITEAALGPDHPDTATRLDNLAGSLWELGRAAEAEPLQRRALAITEAALGPDHPDTATSLDNLAGSLQALGRASQAERLQRRALAITEAALGPDHPTTANRLDNLALSLQTLGRTGQAERLQRRAADIRNRHQK